MYKFLLCTRYLKTRYIALACIISMTLGVATMIVVNSVMAGFTTQMRDRIRGILADVVIETNSYDGADNADLHMALAKQAAGEYFAGMTATVEVYGMLSFEYAGQWITRPITLIGINPEEKAKVGPLVDYLENTTGDIASWNLPVDVMKYRTAMVERQRLLIEDFEDDPESLPLEPPPFDGIEQTSAELEAPPEFGPATTEESTGDAKAENPFLGHKVETAEPVDPAAPLDGRLFIGIGLVSFPYEDQQTGEIKTNMMVRPGDDVKISTVSRGRPPEPIHFPATIVDTFKSGMSEYDSSRVYCNLEYLQKARGMIAPSGERAITSVQIKLKDYDNAPEVVKRLQAVFPPGRYTVRTWEQKQGPLLAAVDVESAILNVLLFLIIAVAGFGILAIFFMIVVEKTRDIGILKSLGASSGGVMSIFLSYGLALGIVGSSVGVGVGLLFVKYINVIEGWLTIITGHKVFDERIYYFPEIPTAVSPAMVFWVALGAITVAVLASILPARRAARLNPVEALRFE